MNQDESQATIVIQPAQGWFDFGLKGVWDHRGLLYYLVWREIKVRYKQTLIGIAWAVIQPLGMMLIFSLVFGELLKVKPDPLWLPYPIFVYTALVPWFYFSHSLSSAANSLIEQKEVITRVFFPRLLLPISGVVVPLIDFVIAMVILFCMMVYYDIALTGAILFLPLFMLLAVASALGFGLWLSALNAMFRDFRYIVPFALMMMLYLSPVIYPSTEVPEKFQLLYGLNPMAGVIEGFRWALLGVTEPPSQKIIWMSSAAVLAILVSGLAFFRRMEGTVTDVV